MTKRISAFGCAVAMCATMLVGCGTPSGPNGVVRVYNWGEYIDTRFFDQFTEQTGIAVHYSTYDSNENMYTKLRAECQL